MHSLQNRGNFVQSRKEFQKLMRLRQNEMHKCSKPDNRNIHCDNPKRQKDELQRELM